MKRPLIARAPTGLALLAATMLLLLGCGSSAGPSTSSSSAANPPAASPAGGGAQPSEPADDASDPGTDPGGSTDNGPIGGDVGDRSKGSIQAQITGGLTANVDLPYAAVLARLLVDGPKTAYLPFTDSAKGTLFLTITDAGLLVQYAGPDQTGLTSAGTPCELHLDKLDATGAKGSFSCKAMMLIKGDGTIGTADMTATFEGHQ